MTDEKINIFKHKYVPQARIMKEEEVKELLEKYKITKQELPKVVTTDAMVKYIEAEPGDVLELSREEGLVKFYRVVVSNG